MTQTQKELLKAELTSLDKQIKSQKIVNKAVDQTKGFVGMKSQNISNEYVLDAEGLMMPMEILKEKSNKFKTRQETYGE